MPIPTPQSVIENCDGERGLKANIFKGMYEAELYFLRGGVVKKHCEGVWIFYGETIKQLAENILQADKQTIRETNSQTVKKLQNVLYLGCR